MAKKMKNNEKVAKTTKKTKNTKKTNAAVNENNVKYNNPFGLEDYAYNLLIDYFKSKPSIKIVRILGSRGRNVARKGSDIDLFIEGTYKPFMGTLYKKEINSLRHPYRIDICDIMDQSLDYQKEYVKQNYNLSKYFYRISDYYPNEVYQEIGCQKPYKNFVVLRWALRYENKFRLNYSEYLNLYREVRQQLNSDILNIDSHIALQTQFKHAFEGAWKLMKDWFKEENKKILFPRQVFKAAEEEGIIENAKLWYEMIDVFSILSKEPFKDICDEMFNRLELKYMPELAKLNDYFYNKYASDEVLNMHEYYNLDNLPPLE